MTEHTPGIPLGSWLADLPDERLIRLLELRPDLAQPPPGSIAALAARAQARQSLKAATDELDFLRLAVIDALLVLHADTAPVREMIRHGENGLLTDFFDAEAMADAAGRVLDAPGDYRELGRRGVEMIRSDYSLDVCLPRILDLYRGVMGV